LSPEKGWKTGLVVVSLLLYSGSIAALALLFVYFNGDDDTSCPLQTFFINDQLHISIHTRTKLVMSRLSETLTGNLEN
jgi:hypothetical protein